MRNFIITIGCGLSLLVACNQPLASDFDAEDVAMQLDSKTISIDNALMALEDILYQTELKTKSALASITKDDIFVIGGNELSITTKSGEELPLPDTLLYAVNFKDGGFSILSANTDLNYPVMCVTDKGEVSLDCFVAGYSFLMSTENNDEIETRSSEEDDYLADIVYADAGKDYLYSLLLSAALIDYYDGMTIYDQTPKTKESASANVGPLLETKWTQSYPFDKYKDPPGCVVIAVAQIMAFNEKPAISKFTSLSSSCTWETLKTVYPCSDYESEGTTFAQNQAGLMAKELGNSDNCDVNSSGGTTTNKARSTLKRFGYDVDKRIGCGSGDINKITQQLANDETPVYMDGCRKDNSTGKQKGHAWVIDGLSNNMFHINWGWQGDCDGYYAKGVFDTEDVVSYDEIDPGNTYTGMEARDYYHYFRILLY